MAETVILEGGSQDGAVYEIEVEIKDGKAVEAIDVDAGGAYWRTARKDSSGRAIFEHRKAPEIVETLSFYLLGVEIKGHVLDNGMRIIERESMQNYLAALSMVDPSHTKKLFDAEQEERDRLNAWAEGRS